MQRCPGVVRSAPRFWRPVPCSIEFRSCSPPPEGGFTVTSPALPELVTEGDTLAEAFSNARDALAAVVELYTDEGRRFPGVALPTSGEIVWSDALVEAP